MSTGGDVRGAVGVGAADRPGALHLLHAADPADHGRRRGGQLGGAAGEALAVADGEQVGAELVDLVEQAGLGGGGQAEHGDDGGHADGDTESGQPGPQLPGAQSDGREPGQVGQLQPPPAQGGGGGHDGSSPTGAPDAVLRWEVPRGSAAVRGRCRGGAGVGDDVAVEDLDLAGHALGDGVVVGDDHDGRAGLVELVDQGQDGLPGGLVEVPGRLVGEHDGGLADEGPGDRDPLALPARELGRAGVGALGQADQLQGVEGPLAALLEGDAGVEEPVGHVVQHGGVFGQEELLEDEPDPGGPQVGHVVVGHGGHVEPGDPHLAAGGPVERSHQLQQGGLARPRRADDPDQLPLANGEVHPPQGLDGRLAGIALGHVVDIEHRHPGLGEGEAVAGRDRVAVGCGWRGVGHVDGTTTFWPAASPEPVTCTSPSASSNSPSDTATRWLIPPAPTTSTA